MNTQATYQVLSVAYAEPTDISSLHIPKYFNPIWKESASKETQEILEWLEFETEKCIAHYPSDNIEELKNHIYYFMIESGLSYNSITDTIKEFLRIALDERVDWQLVVKYLESQQENNEEYLKVLETKKHSSMFVEWVGTEFTVAGFKYFLSTNPNDFLQYSWEMLLYSYNSLNNCELEINDYIENGLLEMFHNQLKK